LFYLCPVDQRLGKQYKLCSKKIIEELFDKGQQIHSFPFSIRFLNTNLPNKKVPFQIAFAVPKRVFKRAYDRNRIKRIMRETVRKNKQSIEEIATQTGQQLALFLLYKHREKLDYQTMEEQTKRLLTKMVKKQIK